MTDNELKLELARMLPDKIAVSKNDDGKVQAIVWIPTENTGDFFTDEICIPIADTELLHCCHLVARGLDAKERIDYTAALLRTNPHRKIAGMNWNQIALSQIIWWTLTNATWQQRAKAMISIKVAGVCQTLSNYE